MGRRVLVADDDAATLTLVAQTMEHLGYAVTRAEDGDELLQRIAAEGPFDLLITDISMPWMTGLQVAQCARTAGLDTPVLVMTGMQIDARDIDSLGVHSALLRKPFGIKQLEAACRKLLSNVAA
jgi:CheY-like chemotaxis protein